MFRGNNHNSHPLTQKKTNHSLKRDLASHASPQVPGQCFPEAIMLQNSAKPRNSTTHLSPMHHSQPTHTPPPKNKDTLLIAGYDTPIFVCVVFGLWLNPSSDVKNRCHHSAPQIAREFMIQKESGQTTYTLGN